jgi:acetyl esterase/lipase
LTIATYGYATGADQSIDAYTLPGTTGRPWVIALHGGSWAAGAKSNADFGSRRLAAQGFVVFNTGYRLISDYPGRPGVRFADQRADVMAAYLWIKAHAGQFGIDPAKGAIYGFSAGGHLAMSVGTYLGAPAIRAIVSASGVNQPHRVQDVADSDPRAGVSGDLPTGSNRTLARWAAVAVGCPHLTTWAECSQRWNDFEPEKYLGADDPPVYMTQGTADPSVPSQTGRSFKYWLDKAGIPNTLVEGQGWGHTEALMFDGGWREANMYAFLKKATGSTNLTKPKVVPAITSRPQTGAM